MCGLALLLIYQVVPKLVQAVQCNHMGLNVHHKIIDPLKGQCKLLLHKHAFALSKLKPEAIPLELDVIINKDNTSHRRQNNHSQSNSKTIK